MSRASWCKHSKEIEGRDSWAQVADNGGSGAHSCEEHGDLLASVQTSEHQLNLSACSAFRKECRDPRQLGWVTQACHLGRVGVAPGVWGVRSYCLPFQHRNPSIP